MAKLTSEIKKSYTFFVQHEKSGEVFTLEELCAATGWKIATPRTYLTKKWLGNFLTRTDHGFRVKGITRFTLEQYGHLMSQKQDESAQPLKPQLHPVVEQLLVKAREAALNAIDSYNRAGTVFRSENYLVMMVIAWRNLLHAVFEKRGIDFVYRDEQGNAKLAQGDERLWDLTKCVKVYFEDPNHPIRLNLEFAIILRNKIEHRYTPEIDNRVAGECQSLLLNFEDILTNEFGDYFALQQSLMIPLQLTRFRSKVQQRAMSELQKHNTEELLEFIRDYRAKLTEDTLNDERYSFQVYLIPKKLSNRSDTVSPSYEYVPNEPQNQEVFDLLNKRDIAVLERERLVPVANQGRYKPNNVVEIVSKKINRVFNRADHIRAWKMYEVRQSGYSPDGCKVEYCQYDAPHKDYVYTEEWIEFLVEKLSDDAEYEKLKGFKP